MRLNFIFEKIEHKYAPPELAFVEVENDAGESIKVGEWSDRDGYRVLTISAKDHFRKLESDNAGL